MMNLAIAQEMESINISDLTLKEKIAQMVMVRGAKYDARFLDLGIGGIFLDKQSSEQTYKNLVNSYQKNSKIKLLVATDMEGYWNPFPFYQSKNFKEIKNKEEAYELGKEHGKILKQVGFNFDFSPVAEEKNTVWPGRSFSGTHEEIKEKIAFYIKGLQEQKILATAKHYPGGSMLKDPHWFKVKAEISREDLELFDYAIKNNVSSVMVGHAIVSGELNSNGKQSTVSEEVISNLRKNFNGLIITDAIGMWGLKWSYLFKPEKLYPDLVKAGNDIILDTTYVLSNHQRVKQGINAIEKAVLSGEIPEERIDDSVTRILDTKNSLQ